MRIGITSNYPHIFVLALAHLLKLSGTVNIVSDGLYSDLLFEGEDDAQVRDNVFFNSGLTHDYELVVNKDEAYDYQIVHFRPIYRELNNLSKKNLAEDKDTIILAAELLNSELHYGKKLFLSLTDLPFSTKYTECILEEKDMLLDYYFGMRSGFSLEKCSKGYLTMLLDIYNILMNTNYTKIKQIKQEKQKGGESNG